MKQDAEEEDEDEEEGKRESVPERQMFCTKLNYTRASLRDLRLKARRKLMKAMEEEKQQKKMQDKKRNHKKT